MNYYKYDIGQTGRKVTSQMDEHKLAARIHGVSSRIASHEDQEQHKSKLDNDEIMD